MKRPLWFAGIVLILAASLPLSPVLAANCPFEPWMEFKGTELSRTADRTAYLYETKLALVDADGAPNAYHPRDVGKPCGARGRGLDCPQHAGYPRQEWWPSVLVPDPADPSRPYVQKSGPSAGYFVSQTWLEDLRAAQTDPARFVDASRIPYLVLPGERFPRMNGTGRAGDVGYAWHTVTGKKTAFIIADHGGGSDARLGEASIALFEALGGTNVNARNGDGLVPGTIRYIVFPRSGRNVRRLWPRTVEDIERQARALLRSVGGERAIDACF